MLPPRPRGDSPSGSIGLADVDSWGAFLLFPRDSFDFFVFVFFFVFVLSRPLERVSNGSRSHACVFSSSHGVVYKAINRLNGSLAAVKKLVRPLREQ